MPIGSLIKKFIHAAVVTAASSKNNDIKQTSANIRVALLVGKPRLNIRLVGLLMDKLESGIYVTCLCCVECIKVAYLTLRD